MSDPIVLEEKRKKLAALGHAMQSGVAFRKNKKDQEPKHLRVGVNMALIEAGALGRILIDKGIVTEEEYLDALIAGLEQEVKVYEQHLAQEQDIEPGKIKLA